MTDTERLALTLTDRERELIDQALGAAYVSALRERKRAQRRKQADLIELYQEFMGEIVTLQGRLLGLN